MLHVCINLALLYLVIEQFVDQPALDVLLEHGGRPILQLFFQDGRHIQEAVNPPHFLQTPSTVVPQLAQGVEPLAAAKAAEASLNFDSAGDLYLNLQATVKQHSATSLVQAVHLTLFFLLAKGDPVLFFKPFIHVFLFLSVANVIIQFLLLDFLLLQPLKVPLIF
jgi:hypothetical protein